jgi:hypothetical protein
MARRQSTALKIGVLDRLDRAVPDQLFYFELVRALYSTPKSIFAATVAALVIIGISGVLSGDAFYANFFLGFIIVGAWRSGCSRLSPHHARCDRRSPDQALGARRAAGSMGLCPPLSA